MALVGFQELWIPLLIVLLLFGGTKIPQLMRGLGLGIGEFKKGLKDGTKDAEEPKPPDKPAP